MKKLLKYIVSVVLAAFALFVGAEEHNSIITGSQAGVPSSEIVVHSLESSTSYSDLCAPRQVTGTSVIHVQGTTAKRTCNSYRNNIEFVRLGKIINTGIWNRIQKESLNIQYPFTEPAHRLIRLGKLII